MTDNHPPDADSGPDTATHKAIWIPSWYELDQPLRVDTPGRFVFYRTCPSWVDPASQGLEPDFDLVFFNQLMDDQPWDARQGRIVAIRHPQLGAVQSVDTYGLDYVFRLKNGQTLTVNAEENPGTSPDVSPAIRNWALTVWFDSLSNPLDRSDGDREPGQGRAV